MSEIVKLDPNNKKRGGNDGGDDSWIKRQALQLAAQLPDNNGDALKVLEWTATIVRFLAGPGAKPS